MRQTAELAAHFKTTVKAVSADKGQTY